MLNGIFLWFAVRLYRDPSKRIARQMFFYSLWYLALLFAAAVIDRIVISSELKSPARAKPTSPVWEGSALASASLRRIDPGPNVPGDPLLAVHEGGLGFTWNDDRLG